nr:hypothetical protein [Ningiella sp. W23]
MTPSVLPRNSKNKIDDEEFQTEEEKFKPKSDEPKPFGYELFPVSQLRLLPLKML